MLTIEINKGGFLPRIVMPHREEVIKLDISSWEGKAIEKIIHTYRSEEKPKLFGFVTLHDLSEEDVELICKIRRSGWRFAKEVAKRRKEKKKPDPEQPQFNVILCNRKKSESGYQSYAGEAYVRSMVHRLAANKQLKKIYSFVVALPSPSCWTLYRPISDKSFDIIKEISGRSKKFAKKVCRQDIEHAREWWEQKVKNEKLLKQKRRQLRQEARSTDAMVYVRLDSYRTNVYYKRIKIGESHIYDVDILRPTKRLFDCDVIRMRYSLLQKLESFKSGKRWDILNYLQGNEEGVENGSITGDNLETMVSVMNK